MGPSSTENGKEKQEAASVGFGLIKHLIMGFHYLSGLVLLALMLLTVADVTGRYVFNRPITGAYELTGLMTAVAVFFGFGYAHARKEHITIDLLYSRLGVKPRRLFDIFAMTVTLGVLLLLVWALYEHAGRTARGGHTTSVLELPVAPVVWLCVMGAISYSLAAGADLIDHLRRLIRGLRRP
ncbi:MAG: TRAP transporter small permease [Firmicutes bacterium]|nr:TRAP transporter small permease [Bacillota bacterium]